MKATQKTRSLIIGIGVVLVVAAFAAGYFLRGTPATRHSPPAPQAPAASEEKVQWWTCSMHPQIKLPKPGKCPICFMDLIPLETGAEEEGKPRELTVGEHAAKLMEIETSPVERRFVTARIRMVGKVDYDETRVSYITAWVPGRLDRLFVDYTGVPVKKGDHMVYLYSPDLLSAQEELLQAIQAAKQLGDSDVSIVRETTEATVAAAREKLRLWGLTPEQVRAIEQRGTADDHITIYAPEGGIVIHKNAQEGMYVNTGTRIYTIADLSQVWVNLDAYESDLEWLRYGQNVKFTAESYPGEVFSGRISFIQPVLDEATRTIKVRVNVSNENGRLKPGMFVRAVAEADVATDGRVMDANLAGKWISPMHPEIIKDGPGTCDICGMPLVRAESLGYVGTAPTDEDKPLVIPASAPLLTGTRAVVYVEVPDQEKPTFEGREIVLGPRAGDYYLVRDGLRQGERVVTRGAFKLDAELQIQAKPSMMSVRDRGQESGVRSHGAEDVDGHAHEYDMTGVEASPSPAPAAVDPKFAKQLADVVDRYMDIQSALADDALESATDAAGKASDALSAVDMELVSGQEHMDWTKHQRQLEPLLSDLAGAKDIRDAREEFALLSEELGALIVRFHPMTATAYRLKCPMAFDGRGAIWLQEDQEAHNPYFGAAMPKCGAVTEEIPALGEAGEQDHD